MPEGHDEHAMGGALYRGLAALQGEFSEFRGRATAQIDGLRDDSKVMRSALHEINGKMQLFIVEQAGVAKVLSDFREVASDVRSLMHERHEQRGSWGAMARVGGLIAAVLTTLGILTAGFIALLDYMKGVHH